MAIKGLRNLCTPSYVYLVISTIALIVMLYQNIGNVNLSGLTISDTLTDGNGQSLSLTSSPVFVSATANSSSSTIASVQLRHTRST